MKINDDLILKTFKQSSSIREVILKLHLPDKGKVSKQIKEILFSNGITEKEIENKKFFKTHIIKKCKFCGKEFYVLRNGKRSKQEYCSQKCSAHKKHTEAFKEKLKLTLKLKALNSKKHTSTYIEKVCPICGKTFYKRSITCSAKCGHAYRIKAHPVSNETRKKLSEIIQKRIKEGKHCGWKTRNIESYPETFFKTVLDNNNIKYEFNKPIQKTELGINENGCYFLDFALNNKIDLEIDGKQHLLKERKIHDVERDNRLINNGWKVYRIAWKALPRNNKYMKLEIEKFLAWYKENV